jgi:predicted  nucleic acid-binding Zn-ribbon protein
MAKKPQKEVVEDIVKNLVDSEISGIQALAKDMTERIRQLEEHSVRIKQYANEIEKMALEASAEKYDKASLDDLINNLEKTLTKLRKKKSDKGEAATAISRKVSPEPKKSYEKEKKEDVVVAEIPEEVAEEVIEEVSEEISEQAVKPGQYLYTTPEGFVVRKTRR